MTSYSRQDVLRILQISCRQLQGWERAGLIPPQQIYTFQDLGQLRTLRTLREDGIRKVLAGMTTPDEVISATMGDKE